MVDQFLAYISEKELFTKKDKILLAISGGIDSVVMARLFADAGFTVGIAHCNFELRAEESDEDEKFVRKLARKMGAECHVKHFDTEQFAGDHKMSIQMAARELRYNWFETLAATEGYDYIALAHHQNDLLETMLLNLSRGTGIAGLHGIIPKRGRFVRPLLFADKEMIYAFVTEKQLIWREDSSNASTKYYRNKIRQEVIPPLQELNPNLAQTVSQTAEKVGAVERFFYRQADKLRETAIQQQGPDWLLILTPLEATEEPVLFLSELLAPWGFSYVQARNIWQASRQEGTTSGKIMDSPTHRLNIDRAQLIISPKSLQEYQSLEIQEGETPVQYTDWQFTFETKPAEGYQIKPDRLLAALDKDKLKYPLKLRKWKAGDWFCPLGMNKKKKLSDFMIDEKIPLNLKERVLVLTSGESIAWIVGYRIDNRFKLTDKSQEVMEVKAAHL
ncbi:tRNA lysidine(34) synthetase TilS [Nafulsella turpanensis]|uniref:tRNA lysidine(34) synthetase TilS n=1 Tax=Nafulsella turpanensis TaxID=1265690 RepID=UPI00034B336A|nr:tRNA lysidine(34) synthetase TilS [Nafulsella turpanensis]